MKRLGYQRYVAQGGDWERPSTTKWRARQCRACWESTSTFSSLELAPLEILKALTLGEPPPRGLAPQEKAAYAQLAAFLGTHGKGYFSMQASRPQTLGYSLTDSPAGLAALILDHDTMGYEQIGQAFEGPPVGGLTRDSILDDISLYWLTGTGASAGRLYWEHSMARISRDSVSLPTAMTVFPGEIFHAPRSWVEKFYTNLTHFNEVDRGGHYAAWEQPELLAQELRVALRPFQVSRNAQPLETGAPLH